VHDLGDLLVLTEAADRDVRVEVVTDLSGMAFTISVAMTPGLTTLIVNPGGTPSLSARLRRKAASSAILLLMPSSPDFDAA
jgi:hypothetical protein